MTDHFTHPLPVAAADPAMLRDLVQLDPCRAWRADLAEAGLAEPLPEELAARWLLWLEIGTVFDRLRMLPAAERAAYARSTAGLWESAERVTGLSRFARVGAVMAAWSGEAPELDGFRELLWAVEQAEADGALRVSFQSVVSAQRLMMGSRDLRRAYAAAQAGRVLRSVGHLSAAEHQFASASAVASECGDSWLSARTALGMGVVNQARGNYPAAHECYLKAANVADENEDLMLASRIGLVSTSLTRGYFDEAVRYALEVIRSKEGQAHDNSIEVLAMLADVGLEVGHFAVALRACEAGLSKNPPKRKLPFFQRGLMISASMLGLDDLARSSATELERMIGTITNSWERAFSQLVLGRVLERYGQEKQSRGYMADALREARVRGYHEITWKAEESLESLLWRRPQEKPVDLRGERTGSSQHARVAARKELDQLHAVAS